MKHITNKGISQSVFGSVKPNLPFTVSYTGSLTTNSARDPGPGVCRESCANGEGDKFKITREFYKVRKFLL